MSLQIRDGLVEILWLLGMKEVVIEGSYGGFRLLQWFQVVEEGSYRWGRVAREREEKEREFSSL